MDNDKIKSKLLKIKALAERGVGGEKEQALKLYRELLEKYELNESDIYEEELSKAWFRYTDATDKMLLTQIFYMVTGSAQYWVKTDKRRNLVGVECTQFELSQILFFYDFYRPHYGQALRDIISAFFIKNSIFPDETARCYSEDDENIKKDLTEEDIAKAARVDMLLRGVDKHTPNKQLPNLGIEQKY